MKPTRKLSRRSVLGSFIGAAAAGGALLVIAGRAGAAQVTDRDTGLRSDPTGRGRGGPIAPGDGDFAHPILMGDVYQSDTPPGMQTGTTDRDNGPAADLPGYGAGRDRRRVNMARCTGVRQRIAHLETIRPRTDERDEQIEVLRAYLDRWRCS